MAEYVQVVNKGSKTYTEEFKGKKLSIAPNKSITMERYEAKQFIGTVGTSSIEGNVEKNLEIVYGPLPVQEETQVEFVSHLDGKKFETQKDLDEHLASLNPEALGAEVLKDEDIDTKTKRRNLMKG
jgi:hypothetical protein